MGRGSSKGSGNTSSGVKATANVSVSQQAVQASTPATQQQTPQVVNPPSATDVKKGNILPKGGVAFSSFEKMTDDQKADVVDQALKGGVPMFLEDSGMQRFAYFTGMSNKPTIVSDSQLNNVSGEEIFRTINKAYNSNIDMGYSSRDIAKQIMHGDFTMYSDSGGSVHGKAIYFANNYRSSSMYGTSGKDPVTMRAKITGKTITERKLNNAYNAALSRGDKLAKACKKAGNQSDARNLYGLAKGYDVIIDPSTGYRMVLNRRGITVSDTIKNTNIGGGSW